MFSGICTIHNWQPLCAMQLNNFYSCTLRSQLNRWVTHNLVAYAERRKQLCVRWGRSNINTCVWVCRWRWEYESQGMAPVTLKNIYFLKLTTASLSSQWNCFKLVKRFLFHRKSILWRWWICQALCCLFLDILPGEGNVCSMHFSEGSHNKWWLRMSK